MWWRTWLGRGVDFLKCQHDLIVASTPIVARGSLSNQKHMYVYTVKPVCNDHLYNKFITCDLLSNVF